MGGSMVCCKERRTLDDDSYENEDGENYFLKPNYSLHEEKGVIFNKLKRGANIQTEGTIKNSSASSTDEEALLELNDENRNKLSSVNLANYRRSLYNPNQAQDLVDIQLETSLKPSFVNQSYQRNFSIEGDNADKNGGIMISNPNYMVADKKFNDSFENQDLGSPNRKLETYSSYTQEETSNEITDFSLKIYVESFEVFYKRCDDFGLVFKPFIKIISPQDPNICIYLDIGNTKRHSCKENLQINQYGSGNDKLNTSSNSDHSKNSQNSQNSKNSLSLSNIGSYFEGDSIERTYYYRESKTCVLNKENYHSSLIIQVNNEHSKGIKNNPVTIGDVRMSINTLISAKDKRNVCMEGFVKIMNRNNIVIGRLKLKIAYNTGQFSPDMKYKKDPFEEKDFNLSELIKDINEQEEVEKPKPKFYEDNNINNNINKEFTKFNLSCMELSHSTLDRHFFSGLTETEIEILIGETMELIDFPFATDHNGEGIFTYFYKILKMKKLLPLYEFFNKLLEMIRVENYLPIFNFYRMLTTNEKKEFLTLPSRSGVHPYLTRHFFKFIHDISRVLRESVSDTQVKVKTNNQIHSKLIQNNLHMIEDSLIITQIIETLKKIVEVLKNEQLRKKRKIVNTAERLQELNIEDYYTYRDITIYTTNILVDLATKIQDEKIMNIDDMKEECTKSYENSIKIISSRIHLIRIVDLFIDDAQVVAGFAKLFRKLVQVLTNIHATYLIPERLSVDPSVFSTEFKKLLITQADGIFVNTINMVFAKYYHYPEIHINMLVIIHQLTTFMDESHLKLISNYLSMVSFKDYLDIYRGSFKSNSGIINIFHMKVLSNISEIVKYKVKGEMEDPSLMQIAKDLSKYYRKADYAKAEIRTKFEENYRLFKEKKKFEVEFQDCITCIGVNFSLSFKLSKYLIKNSFFYEDILEFLMNVVYPERYLNITIGFIEYVTQKRRSKNLKNLIKYISNIIENSILIITQTLELDDDELLKIFVSKLKEYNFDSHKDILRLYKHSRELMFKYGLPVKKMDEAIKRVKKCLNVD